MEILLWLMPAALVTLVAMVWVSWIGRAGRGEVDRDEAVRRLGAALDKEHVVPPGTPRRPREPATGVAVRRAVAADVQPAQQSDEQSDEQRRAS